MTLAEFALPSPTNKTYRMLATLGTFCGAAFLVDSSGSEFTRVRVGAKITQSIDGNWMMTNEESTREEIELFRKVRMEPITHFEVVGIVED